MNPIKCMCSTACWKKPLSFQINFAVTLIYCGDAHGWLKMSTPYCIKLSKSKAKWMKLPQRPM